MKHQHWREGKQTFERAFIDSPPSSNGLKKTSLQDGSIDRHQLPKGEFLNIETPLCVSNLWKWKINIAKKGPGKKQEMNFYSGTRRDRLYFTSRTLGVRRGLVL